MSLQTQPHFLIQSSELAKWLKTQGDSHWWSVDGDPLLMGLIAFPCPSSELAAELRRQNRNLLLQDKEQRAVGETISAADLDRLADSDNNGNRLFLLEWEDAQREDLGWLLVEDRETAESTVRSSQMAKK